MDETTSFRIWVAKFFCLTDFLFPDQAYTCSRSAQVEIQINERRQRLQHIRAQELLCNKPDSSFYSKYDFRQLSSLLWVSVSPSLKKSVRIRVLMALRICLWILTLIGSPYLFKHILGQWLLVDIGTTFPKVKCVRQDYRSVWNL